MSEMTETENKSLVNISLEMARMAADLIQAGGELTPEFEELLDLKTGDLKTKIDHYKLFSESLKASVLNLKDLELQFYGARKTAENAIDRLKENIKFSMNIMNVDSLSGHAWIYKRSKLASKLEIDKDAVLPEKYYQEVTPPPLKVLDKETLMADLGLGVEIAGARLLDNYMVRSSVNKPGQIKKSKKGE